MIIAFSYRMNMVKVMTSRLLQFGWLLLQVKEHQIQLNVTGCSSEKQLEVTVTNCSRDTTGDDLKCTAIFYCRQCVLGDCC